MKFLIYYFFFILIVLVFAYINTLNEEEKKREIKKQQEAFTPKIREYYRPYVRKARIISEGFYDKNKSNMSTLFKNFGIL